MWSSTGWVRLVDQHVTQRPAILPANICKYESKTVNIIPNPDGDRQRREEVLKRKVVKEGGKWCVKSKKGKSLGCYDTKKEALARLRQVEYHKNK